MELHFFSTAVQFVTAVRGTIFVAGSPLGGTPIRKRWPSRDGSTPNGTLPKMLPVTVSGKRGVGAPMLTVALSVIGTAINFKRTTRKTIPCRRDATAAAVRQRW